MSRKQWFSYDPIYDSFRAHPTREAARAAAEAALGRTRDESTEGWDDEVEGICWGEIVERTVEISRLEVPDGVTVDDDGLGSDGVDYSTIPSGLDAFVDYGLAPFAGPSGCPECDYGPPSAHTA